MSSNRFIKIGDKIVNLNQAQALIFSEETDKVYVASGTSPFHTNATKKEWNFVVSRLSKFPNDWIVEENSAFKVSSILFIKLTQNGEKKYEVCLSNYDYFYLDSEKNLDVISSLLDN
ncbi:MAG TPA: hypothetical protein V6C65_17435 [Allocoleopsis sp.]